MKFTLTLNNTERMHIINSLSEIDRIFGGNPEDDKFINALTDTSVDTKVLPGLTYVKFIDPDYGMIVELEITLGFLDDFMDGVTKLAMKMSPIVEMVKPLMKMGMNFNIDAAEIVNKFNEKYKLIEIDEDEQTK